MRQFPVVGFTAIYRLPFYLNLGARESCPRALAMSECSGSKFSLPCWLRYSGMHASGFDRRRNPKRATVPDRLKFFLFLIEPLGDHSRVLIFSILLSLPLCKFDRIFRIGATTLPHFVDPVVKSLHTLKVFCLNLAQVSQNPPGPWFVVHRIVLRTPALTATGSGAEDPNWG